MRFDRRHWLLLAVSLGACAETPPPTTRSSVSVTSSRPSGLVQEGKCSFYGREAQGGPTASGERFDMHQLTAAHRTLKMGTHVRVTNLRNGRSVVVRINDRGPYGRGRIIDVSLAAAKALDMIDAGVVPARVEVLP
jgi:rare lipoprotein A